MSQRDVLTANRDKRVWAVAKGSDIKVDDSNLPDVEELQSNKPGRLARISAARKPSSNDRRPG